MPLQQSSAEAVEAVTAYGASASETITEAATSKQDGPRYDTAAVKEILARAEAMQAYHRATLTPDAIIALGQEVGVEPEFVRHAISQRDKAEVSPTTSSMQKRTLHKREISVARSLTGKQWVTALVPAALYLLFCLLLTPFNVKELEVSSNAAICFYVFLPAFLAVCVGSTGKSKRVGAIGGALMGLAVLFSLLTITAFHHQPMPSLDELFPVFAVLVGSGVTLGVASAALCQLVSPSRRKRLRVRLVVETDEVDETPKGEWA